MIDGDAYGWLMAGANRDVDPFDTHIVASILALAIEEGGALPDRCGLTQSAIADMAGQYFPSRAAALADMAAGGRHTPEIEEESVRGLLLSHASGQNPLETPLAAMVARRAVEPNHLWQDLGLRNRDELSDLLDRHFGPLARQNSDGMKWKRFFYRKLCEAEGFVLCTTPVCTDCSDFDMCFGEETGEARLARSRRADTQTLVNIG
ncbi:Nitrogenase FeMo-cofactor synthesis molybdenum delivery protein NifQ [Rhodovulum sp. P5]|uniref:nitrogen fixation protein NifQ n=1 Tax=Rhodovulum sp. P5 TaxID=1564506 RepID=UPI0009C24324|nr:nitrogen fixation protein NifQ [Rhodovulum sp. P5]ARE41297.1 Nitrogenase FeMo-cofactor synthesis molybdenum delivery protein NifQ [Rhodovulum sp. P5]